MPFIKLALTSFFLFSLFNGVNTNLIFKSIGEANFKFIFFAIVTLLIQIILISLRWQLIGNLIKIKNHFKFSLSINLVGHFFNQILPTSIGGDFVRAFLFSRKSKKLKESIYYVFFDRIIGFFVLGLIALFTLIYLLTYKNLSAHFLIIFTKFLFVFLLFPLFFLALFNNKIIKFPSYLNTSFVNIARLFIIDFGLLFKLKWVNLHILLLSILTHCLIVLSLIFCALIFNIHLNMTQSLLCFSIFLLSSIPISYAGWGLREGLMIFILGMTNIPLESSLAISLTFGVVQLASALPGLALFIRSPFNLLNLKYRVL